MEQKTNKYPSWVDIFAIIGIFLLLSFCSGMVLSLFTEPSGIAKALGYSIPFILVITYALVQKRIRAKGEKIFNLSLKVGSPSLMLWGVILTIAVSTLVEPLVLMFDQKHFETLSNMIGGGTWMLLTSIALAPILEEILFRGIIQSAIAIRIGKWLSLLVASLIFGAIHIIPPQVVNAFFVSLVLGYIFIRSASLLSVIVIHSINNAIAYLTMKLNGGEYLSLKSMITNQTTYYVVYICCVALFLLAFIYVIKSLREEKLKLTTKKL